jgi:hypothetical protein
MDDQPTCGKGLAANAVLPATIGELLDEMAAVLDRHQLALDLTDDDARPEHHAYVTLIAELRSLSAQLTATSHRMAGYRDLPMGRHDEGMMSDRQAVEVFEALVRAEQKLLSLLSTTITEHQSLLNQMR